MGNNITDIDIEYFKKFVNSNNEGFESVQKTKAITVSIFLIVQTIGIIFSFIWVDSFGLRSVFLMIMAGGIVCTMASDKWFSGNRGYLFMVLLQVLGSGTMCFLVGIFLAYGISNVLIFVFVVINAVIAIFVLSSTVRRISFRQIPKVNRRKDRDYILGGLGGGLGYAASKIISRATEGVDVDISQVVLVILIMGFAILIIWSGVPRVFQLYYAAKYDINVVNTWDVKKGRYGQGKEYQCPLLGKTIEGNNCIKINYGNEELLEPDKLNAVKKELDITSDEIKQVCKGCEHYPFKEEQDERGGRKGTVHAS